MHYARKLQVLDTAERDRLQEELEGVQKEKRQLELKLARANLNLQLHEKELAELKQKLAHIQETQTCGAAGYYIQASGSVSHQSSSQQNLMFYRNVEICKEGGCRVLAYNKFMSLLVVSQCSTNTLFPGYGIKKVDAVEFRPLQFVFLHPKAIRDLAFHPLRDDMLLSVSLDRCAKLFNVSSNRVVQSYTTDNPLWSCCWDASNSNLFFVGTNNGAVLQYDVRFSNGLVCRLTSPDDSSPVTSLAAIPPCPGRTLSRGGFLACRLNSFWAYEQQDADYVGLQLPFEGPFVSLCYDQNSEHVLISMRPSIRYSHSRHILCQLPQITAGLDPSQVCIPVHSFQGSTSQNLLSRPCQVSVPGDTLVAAHQESLKSVALWSVSSGQQVLSFPASQPVIHLCPIQVNNTQYLAALSEKVLTIYNFK
jgi:E3 ubiquitin-protein ligase RFWD3